MAKRVVQECDLSKREYDPAETVTLVIKRSGKKTGRTYELAPDSAAKLEQQLVSGQRLESDWRFLAGLGGVKPPHEFNRANIDESDESLIARKKKSMQEEGFELDGRIKTSDEPAIMPDLATSTCLHMNKGPVVLTIRNNERYAYRICKACNGRVVEKSKTQRDSFLNEQAPS